jgi:hypothetical protein
MNEKTKDRILWGVAIILLSVAFAGIVRGVFGFQAIYRDSRETITRIQAENRELTDRLSEIQSAIDTVAIGLGDAANTAGSVADGLGDVITGLDDIDRVLSELLGFLGRVEEIIAGGVPDSP